MSTVINNNFLTDILHLCVKRKEFLEVCSKHLHFHYMPMEEYKELWRTIKNYYSSTAKVPSLGYLYQCHSSGTPVNKKICEILDTIKSSMIPDSSSTMSLFESYIKDSKTIEFYDKFVDLYQSGKREEARNVFTSASDSLKSFSLTKDTDYYKEIFNGFEYRDIDRTINFMYTGGKEDIMPLSIDQLDFYYKGGIRNTDLFGFLARSGIGKTKLLRHIGVGAARRGFPVLHIQAEGSEEECIEGYDATWTACLMSDVRRGSIPDDKYKALTKVVRNIRNKGGEIYVHAFEQFSSATMHDVRMLVNDINNTKCHIGCVLLDYLELVDPSDGKNYAVSEERHRRISIARKAKNIAMEFGTRFGTATQANDVNPKLYNDPSFVMTRHNISECKGLIDPFSNFVTVNQTEDEYKEGILRLYIDKARKTKGGQTMIIKSDYDRDRFYDRMGTINYLSGLYNIMDESDYSELVSKTDMLDIIGKVKGEVQNDY